jgi:hypothetical protein
LAAQRRQYHPNLAKIRVDFDLEKSAKPARLIAKFILCELDTGSVKDLGVVPQIAMQNGLKRSKGLH